MLLSVPGEEHPVVRSMAGIPRGKNLEKYRHELFRRVYQPILSSGEGIVISDGRAGDSTAAFCG